MTKELHSNFNGIHNISTLTAARSGERDTPDTNSHITVREYNICLFIIRRLIQVARITIVAIVLLVLTLLA